MHHRIGEEEIFGASALARLWTSCGLMTPNARESVHIDTMPELTPARGAERATRANEEDAASQTNSDGPAQPAEDFFFTYSMMHNYR
jgi:hypothetical protein